MTDAGEAHETERGVFVYGLAVTGLGSAAHHLCAPGPERSEVAPPALRVRCELREPPTVETRPQVFDSEHAETALIESGWLSISRSPVPTATFRLTRELSPAELLHPWLVPAAAAASIWQGHKVLHGGVVCAGSLAVAVVGDKDGGKSSLLAWASTYPGLHVLADDLVVINNEKVYAGPRCIDLRAAALPHLPLHDRDAEQVRGGTRTRLILPPGPTAARLVGIVVLAWADELSLEPVPVVDRLGTLLPHAMIGSLPAGHGGVLDFVRFPTWRLSRPRDWAKMPAAVESLRDILAAAAAGASAR